MGTGIMEAYFPRGGTGKGSSLSFKSKVISKKHNQNTFKRKPRHPRKRFKKKNDNASEEKETVYEKLDFSESKGFAIDKKQFNLYYKDLTHSLSALCAVQEIKKDKILVCLPGRLQATLSIIDVSKPLKHVSEEDLHSIKLKNMFRVGQIFSCKVLQMQQEDKFYRVMVTTDPAKVNSALIYSSIQRGRVLQMAINGIEDHGYSLYSGVPNLTAFLPFDKADYLHKLHSVERLSIGMILWIKVYKSTLSELSNIVHCTAEPGSFSKPLLDEDITPELLPGTTVKVIVNDTKSFGTLVQVNASSLKGGIPWAHLRKFFEQKPKVGDCIIATVLYRYPLSNSYFFTHDSNSLFDPPQFKIRNGEFFNKCKVIKWTYEGVYVELPLPLNEERSECFISYASLGRPNRENFEKEFSEGTEIDCLITGIDFLTGIYSGTVKPEDSITKRADLEVGSLIKVTISQYRSKGIVVTVNPHISGFVLWDHTTDSAKKADTIAINLLKLKFPLNSTHTARVIRAGDENLWLSLKPGLVSNPSPMTITDFNVGDCYNVRVKDVSALIIYVTVNDKFIGSIPRDSGTQVPLRNAIIPCYVKKVLPHHIQFSMAPCSPLPDAQIGSVVKVTITMRRQNYYFVKIEDHDHLNGMVKYCHCDQKNLQIGSIHQAKVLKVNNSNVKLTLRKDVIKGEVPSSIDTCLLGSVVTGLVTLVKSNFTKVMFANDCHGLIYRSNGKSSVKLHSTITCKVIDKETNYLILGPVSKKPFQFHIGEMHVLTVDNVTAAGIFATCILPSGSSKDVFVPKNQLDDFEDICQEKIDALKKGDTITDAVIMAFDSGTPIFTTKKSITTYLKNHRVLGRSDFLKKLGSSKKIKTNVYLPCTIKQIADNLICVNAPVQNVSFCSVKTTNIEVEALKLHQTVVCYVDSYDAAFDCLQLQLPSKLPEDILLEWALERTKEYVEWARETFTFGSAAEFYTEKSDRTGKITQNGHTSDAFMLGLQKVQKFQKVPVLTVHKEKRGKEFLTYVVHVNKSLIRKNISDLDYDSNSLQDVTVKILHQSDFLEIGSIDSPEHLKGLIVYLPRTLANQVRPTISDQFLTQFQPQAVKIIGIGQSYFIGVKPETLEIYKMTTKIEKSEPLMSGVSDSDKYGELTEDPEVSHSKKRKMSLSAEESDESSIKKKKDNTVTSNSKKRTLLNEEINDLSSGPGEKAKKKLNVQNEALSVENNPDVSYDEELSRKTNKTKTQEIPDSKTFDKIEDSNENFNTVERVIPEDYYTKMEAIENLAAAVDNSYSFEPSFEHVDRTRQALNMFAVELGIDSSLPSLLNAEKTGNSQQHADDDSDSEDEMKKSKKKGSTSKSERKRRQEEKERALRDKEEELLNAMDNPQSSEHFERLAMARPTDSKMWIQYMAFQLQAIEIEKARAIGKRALGLIPAKEEQDRLNVWLALLNLEHLYGSKEEFKETLTEALRCNDDFKVNLKVLDMYAESKNKMDLEHHVNNMVKKYKDNFETWYNCLSALMAAGMEEKARLLLQRALKSLLQREHVSLISRFALLENKAGHEEEAQTLLDNILTSYPQRIDVWSLYTDMLTKSQHYDLARQIFERASSAKLPAKKMKTIYTKWLKFESSHGTKKTLENVKKAAENYVNLKLPAD